LCFFFFFLPIKGKFLVLSINKKNIFKDLFGDELLM